MTRLPKNETDILSISLRFNISPEEEAELKRVQQEMNLDNKHQAARVIFREGLKTLCAWLQNKPAN